MNKYLSIETGVFAAVGIAAVIAALSGMTAPSIETQAIALALGVALIGLPHGALDPLLARRAGMLADLRAAIIFHAAYVLAALLMVGLWIASPAPALLLFLIYSAYHFAGDWMAKPTWARITLGAAVLSLPACTHASDVAEIYALLSGDTARQIATMQHRLAPLWLAIIAASAALFVLRRNYAPAIELMTVVVTALTLPPLVYFLLYFCALHSPRHFLEVWNASLAKRQAAIVAAAYTALTIIIAVPVALALTQSSAMMPASMQQIVFIGLAALTVPHMILSSLLEKRSHV